jgi:succinate dehydrogenase / fumarate reductase, cytochrome b subunit
MSSSAPTKRLYPVNSPAAGKGIVDWLKPFVTTSVGMKVTTAITGTMLTLFVVGHLVGNLKIFAGQDALNSYAKFLKDQGPFLWVARLGLLGAIVLHMAMALLLKKRSLAARPVAYHHPQTIQASIASRTMPWTGLVILLFVVFHIAHYTLCILTDVNAYDKFNDRWVVTNYHNLVDDKGRHDVYSMVLVGFKSPAICLIYVVVQLILAVHLTHGIASVFQTLGLNSPKIQPFVKKSALGIATLIAIGNIAIVVAVLADLLPVANPMTVTNAW